MKKPLHDARAFSLQLQHSALPSRKGGYPTLFPGLGVQKIDDPLFDLLYHSGSAEQNQGAKNEDHLGSIG